MVWTRRAGRRRPEHCCLASGQRSLRALCISRRTSRRRPRPRPRRRPDLPEPELPRPLPQRPMDARRAGRRAERGRRMGAARCRGYLRPAGRSPGTGSYTWRPSVGIRSPPTSAQRRGPGFTFDRRRRRGGIRDAPSPKPGRRRRARTGRTPGDVPRPAPPSANRSSARAMQRRPLRHRTSPATGSTARATTSRPMRSAASRWPTSRVNAASARSISRPASAPASACRCIASRRCCGSIGLEGSWPPVRRQAMRRRRAGCPIRAT